MSFYHSFSIIEAIFPLFFLLVFSIIVVTLVRSILQWHKNNQSPRLTVDALVVSKRMSVSHHSDADHIGTHTSTSYYATFEVESGDRMELHLSGREYGMLAESDLGKLTFQGTRYLGFERR